MDPGVRGQGSAIGIRDAGLRRLAQARRWLVVGSLAFAGVLAGLVAQAKPGRSSTATTARSSARPAHAGSGARTPSGGSGAAVGGAQLSPPSQAPAPAPATPSAPVVSGGS